MNQLPPVDIRDELGLATRRCQSAGWQQSLRMSTEAAQGEEPRRNGLGFQSCIVKSDIVLSINR